MNLTVQNAIDGFNRAYPAVGATDSLALFLEVYWEVLAISQIEQDVQSKNLTNGTREYELSYDPLMVNIRQVMYVTSATAATALTPVSTDWMDNNVSMWRTTTDVGTPARYYVEGVDSAALSTQGKIVIGLDPIPDTSTSVGYPVIKLYGTELEVPSATSKLPAYFQSARVFIEGMKRNYASDRDTAETHARFEDAFSRELVKALGFIDQHIEDLPSPRFEPDWMKTSVVQ